jgi:CRP/FNR family transcriptional regulator
MPVILDLLATPESPGAEAPLRWRDLCAQASPALGLPPLPHSNAGKHRVVPRGSLLFGNGDPLTVLYELQSGSFKTSVCARDGRQQVTGFQLAGDWLGLDGIDTGRHSLDAVALEDSQVFALDYVAFGHMLKASPTLQRQFNKVMSREIVREHALLLVLGRMHAEQRVATFLLDLWRRMRSSGYATEPMLLHMSRDEMGSYLGLKLETVSRSFSKLQADGVLEVHHRRIHVLDAAALERVTHGPVA